MEVNQDVSAGRTAPSRFRWVVAGLIFVVYTFAAADRANLGVALPFIRREFAMTNTEAGALLSLFALAYALGQLPAGLLVGRFGVRRLLSLGMIATSVATGLLGTAGSVFALKAYRAALGLAESVLPVSMSATINQWFPPQEKGTASGIFLAAVKFGPVIVPPIGTAMLALWGWRSIFFAFAVPGLLLSVVWYVMVASKPSQSKFVNEGELAIITERTAAGKASDVLTPAKPWLDRFIRTRDVPQLDTNGKVMRSWNVYGCAIGYCFQLGISNVLLTWIPTYLLTVKHFSVANMGLVAAAPWVGAVVGNLLGGWLSDKVLGKRRKPGMMLSALSMAVMMIVLVNSPADPLPYAALMCLTGVLLSIGFSAYGAYPMGMSSQKVYPLAAAVVNMGGQLGGAMAPFVTGLLLDSVGWSAVFIFLGAGSLVSFIALLTIVEPLKVAPVTAASAQRTSSVNHG